MTSTKRDENEQKILNQYLADLYGVFSKMLGEFVIDEKQEFSEDTRMREIKLLAMLQEIIKIKRFTSA